MKIEPVETEFRAILELLDRAGVKFIVIGGIAGIAHGNIRLTTDVDVVYERSRENMQRLVEALAPIQPYLRGAPPGLPFRFDLATLRNGLNFTFRTTLGDLDLLGEVAGGGNYEQLLSHSEDRTAFGVAVKCVSLETLIALKRAAGRPKDFEPIAELEGLLQERKTGRADFQP